MRLTRNTLWTASNDVFALLCAEEYKRLSAMNSKAADAWRIKVIQSIAQLIKANTKKP